MPAPDIPNPDHASTKPEPPQHSLLQQQPSSPEAQRDAQLRSLMYKSSLAICVACPIVALMPPRKMDLFTLGLGIAFCTSAGYALEQHTGKGLVWHVSSRLPGVQRKERERIARETEKAEAEMRSLRAREEQMRRWKEEEERRLKERGFFKRLWMGSEEEDWNEKRVEREREALDEGRGYGSLIVEHLKDVVWGKSNEDDDEDENDKKEGE